MQQTCASASNRAHNHTVATGHLREQLEKPDRAYARLHELSEVPESFAERGEAARYQY